MARNTPVIHGSIFARWAVALILALVGMCMPCLAFASDDAPEGATNLSPALDIADGDESGQATEPNLESPDGDADDKADAETGDGDDAGSETHDGAPDGVNPPDTATAPVADKIDGDEQTGTPSVGEPVDSVTHAPSANNDPTGENAATDMPSASMKTPDMPDADNASPAKTNHVADPDETDQPASPIKANAPPAKVEPVAPSVTHCAIAALDIETAAPASMPQFTCADAPDEPVLPEEGSEGAPFGRTPAPATPAQSGPPDPNAPCPSPPGSSWGEQQTGGGQAYDELAFFPEMENPTVLHRQTAFLSSRNARVEAPYQGPKRCRSPGSVQG